MPRRRGDDNPSASPPTCPARVPACAIAQRPAPAGPVGPRGPVYTATFMACRRSVRSERLVAPANQWSEQRRVAGSLFHRTNRSGVLAQRDVQCHRRRGVTQRRCTDLTFAPDAIAKLAAVFPRSCTRRPAGPVPSSLARIPASGSPLGNSLRTEPLPRPPTVEGIRTRRHPEVWGFRDLGPSEGGRIPPRFAVAKSLAMTTFLWSANGWESDMMTVITTSKLKEGGRVHGRGV